MDTSTLDPSVEGRRTVEIMNGFERRIGALCSQMTGSSYVDGVYAAQFRDKASAVRAGDRISALATGVQVRAHGDRWRLTCCARVAFPTLQSGGVMAMKAAVEIERLSDPVATITLPERLAIQKGLA